MKVLYYVGTPEVMEQCGVTQDELMSKYVAPPEWESMYQWSIIEIRGNAFAALPLKNESSPGSDAIAFVSFDAMPSEIWEGIVGTPEYERFLGVQQ